MKNSLLTIIFLFTISLVSAQTTTINPSFSVVASYYTENNYRYASNATLMYNNSGSKINNLSKLFVDKIYSSPNSIDVFFYDAKGFYQGQAITDLNQEVYMGVDLGKDIIATFTFSGTNKFEKVLLLDKMTNIYYDLNTTPEFEVYLQKGRNKDRFVIIFAESPSIIADNENTDITDTTDVTDTNDVADVTTDNDIIDTDNATDVEDNNDYIMNEALENNTAVSADITTGLDSNKSDDNFSVYASYKTLTVSTGGNNTITEVIVINMGGQIVKSVSGYDSAVSIDMSNSPSGVYIVKAMVDSEMKTSKVVIR